MISPNANPKPLENGLLVDTNVWLSHYLGFRTDHSVASRFVSATIENQVPLYYAVHCVKDVFYQTEVALKRYAKAQGALTEASASAASESAWAIVTNLQEIATVVGADLSDVWLAQTYKEIHADFEDDMLAAAMKRCHADYLVTFDQKLRKRSPVAVLTPEELLCLL